MKKLLALLMTMIMLVSCPCAYAATAGTPPTPSPYSGELIKQGVAGEIIVRLQQRLRDMGYLNYKPTGIFRSMSVDAIIKYQQYQQKPDGTSMIADGTVGTETLGLIFSLDAARAPIAQDVHIPFGPSLDGLPEEKGTLVNWNELKGDLEIGKGYDITDYNTSKSFRVVYVGGENHAEVECESAADTAMMLEVFGGEFNYSKRPMLFKLNDKLIAASMQGQPHGEDYVSRNEMSGHMCLYFEGSLSNVGKLPDAEHIKQLYIAAGRS